MSRIRVMHMTDTLAAAGAERVAVNFVNLLPRDRFEPFLCATREEGPLANFVQPDVVRLNLSRKWRFDRQAIHRLIQFIKENDIQIIHAHGSALFVARWAALHCSRLSLVWHDHFGLCMVRERPRWIYRWLTKNVGAVVAVNQRLADWSRNRLGVPANRVWYLPNFVCQPDTSGELPTLPGESGSRIICVAKFRPQKDHITLLRAMATVKKEQPKAHLLLVGGADDPVQLANIQSEIETLGLQKEVTWLGERYDIGQVLKACDIGVLSSQSEGLPLALLEYGMAGLPVVATQVGQCSEVLAGGEAGLLVQPSQPVELAEGLLSFLKSSEKRAQFGHRLKSHVDSTYEAQSVIRQMSQIYESIVDSRIPQPSLC